MNLESISFIEYFLDFVLFIKFFNDSICILFYLTYFAEAVKIIILKIQIGFKLPIARRVVTIKISLS